MSDRVAELVDRLQQQVAALVTSDDWQAWLSVAARFHRYSANNVLLIYGQRPDATHVAGYRTWQTLGRAVRRGERGIRILAPCTYRAAAADTDDADPETDRPNRIRGFRVATIFDIAQTDGEALPMPPAPARLEGEAPRALLENLTRQIETAGFTYHRGPLPAPHTNANGITDYTTATVTVRDDLPPAHATKTTAHELAHVLLHQPGKDHGTRARVEVEAESVAYVVCNAWDLDPADYSFPYVARWSDGNQELVTATAQRVIDCARTILQQT